MTEQTKMSILLALADGNLGAARVIADLSEYLEEIQRAYRVLAEQGEFQNITDIKGWYAEKRISDNEYKLLLDYNKCIASKLLSDV